jgi:hypothetical protein
MTSVPTPSGRFAVSIARRLLEAWRELRREWRELGDELDRARRDRAAP